ncbi:MAG TPA: flagellar hook-basal body complex protein FliE [Fimbriimonadaceae bacterium]|nr:flagellar hook-basal body complex protein FliE [Fimbriimonadaceae bacterium]
MRIGAINPALQGIAQQTTKTQDADGKPDDFGKMLMDVIKEVNSSQQKASDMQDAFMTGQNVELHELMISMERAGLAMELTLQVRNKILESYQEISRMQV